MVKFKLGNLTSDKPIFDWYVNVRNIHILICISGQLPRSADVIVEHDLVDKVKPGDRVQIVASFRALPGKQGGYTSGTFRTVLLANNIILRGGAEDGPSITGEDVAKCKKLAKQEKKKIFNILSR